jgi:hypothetical protein
VNEVSALPVSEKAELKNGELDLLLPVNGMALIEVASMK